MDPASLTALLGGLKGIAGGGSKSQSSSSSSSVLNAVVSPSIVNIYGSGSASPSSGGSASGSATAGGGTFGQDTPSWMPSGYSTYPTNYNDNLGTYRAGQVAATPAAGLFDDPMLLILLAAGAGLLIFGMGK